MSELFADRFMRVGASWIDIATGACVRLLVAPAPAGSGTFVWDDLCATLATLRHPLLNQLVDYGAADARNTFEAYSVGSSLRAGSAAGARLLAHAARFLEAHGICLSAARGALAMRTVSTSARPAHGRALGLTLQRRRVLTAVEEMLADTCPAGVLPLHVAGCDGSGLRTLHVQIARTARLQGYVPVCGAVLRAMPWLWSQLRQRHVCVLLEPEHEAADAGARLISSLGLESARRHVLIQFTRDVSRPRAVAVDPLGITAMIAMVYADIDDGPVPAEVHEAARAADGRPGQFLARLRAAAFTESHSFSLVHESAPAYTVPAPGPEVRVAANCARRSVFTADVRALRLASRGRHAAALRLLQRAVRVLELRREHRGASRCAEQLGWILRDRGRSAAAAAQFDKALALAPEGVDRLRCTIAIGIVRTDDCQFAEAEATLRSAMTAADVLGAHDVGAHAQLALARCLFWQSRYEEAGQLARGVMSEPHRARALALAARVHAAQGQLREAVTAAGRATELSAHADLRTVAAAYCAKAMAHRAIGDVPGIESAARAGLAAAAAAHLPLASLRIRAVLLKAPHQRANGNSRHLAGQIRGALERLPLSALIRRQLEAAVGDPAPIERAPASIELSFASIEIVQQLLETAAAAADDRAAVAEVCKTVCERLRAASVQVNAACSERRLLARAGRPWSGDLRIVERTLAAGACCTSGSGEPREAASPVRYAGETVAVLACRWTASVEPDLADAVSMLRAGALAGAPSIRAVLDRPQLPLTEPALRDLIGSANVMSGVRDAMARAARAPYPVLIEGESGSGKELVARAHPPPRSAARSPFCALNCAALSDDLVEAELFGHARGAFTGAVGERPGLFEEADAGTLFLDEIGELSLRAQAKLLRVLQDGELRRVGENIARRVDVRIVAATNRDLEAGRRGRAVPCRSSLPPRRRPHLACRRCANAATTCRCSRRTSGARPPRASAARATLARRRSCRARALRLARQRARAAERAGVAGRARAAARAGAASRCLPAHDRRSDAPRRPWRLDAARRTFERRFVRAALARSGGQRARPPRELGVTRQGLTKTACARLRYRRWTDPRSDCAMVPRCFGYLVRRLLLTLPVLLGVATLVFSLIHLVPGDPVQAMLGESGIAGGRRAAARARSASIGRCSCSTRRS